MSTPTDAKDRGYAFSIGANDFYVGLFDYDPVAWPDIVQPRLLLKEGLTWKTLKEYDVLWKDLQEELGEEYLAGSIVKMFNLVLEEYTEGGAMSFVDKLAAIFRLRLYLVEGRLAIKAP